MPYVANLLYTAQISNPVYSHTIVDTGLVSWSYNERRVVFNVVDTLWVARSFEIGRTTSKGPRTVWLRGCVRLNRTTDPLAPVPALRRRTSRSSSAMWTCRCRCCLQRRRWRGDLKPPNWHFLSNFHPWKIFFRLGSQRHYPLRLQLQRFLAPISPLLHPRVNRKSMESGHVHGITVEGRGKRFMRRLYKVLELQACAVIIVI